MTVTTEDGGRQNLFAREPQMYIDPKIEEQLMKEEFVTHNEKGREAQWSCCHDGYHRRPWCIRCNWSDHPRHLVMGFLIVAMTMMIAFGAGAMMTQSGEE